MRLKAKHIEYIDVTLSRREVMEAACRIICEANNMPTDAYIVLGQLVSGSGSGFSQTVRRAATEEDYEAQDLMEKIMGYAHE